MSVNIPPSVICPPPAPPEPIWRLTVEQYHQMIDAGILTEDDPVELLEGVLVATMPKNPPHRFVTKMLRQALERLLPSGWSVDAQEPITTDTSELEPDIAVFRGDSREYLQRHPGPDDLVLVAEVAHATLQRDRTTKKRVYARASIPVYWIVNLIDLQVEVYTEPSGPAQAPDYGQRQDYHRGDQVPVIIDGQEVGRVTVAELFP